MVAGRRARRHHERPGTGGRTSLRHGRGWLSRPSPPRQLRAGGLAWSPDGKSIAYAGSEDDAAARLWTISQIHGPPFTVAASDSIEDPVWSPDGSRIAFVESTGWFAVEADGAHQRLEIDELKYLSWGDGSFQGPGLFG